MGFSLSNHSTMTLGVDSNIYLHSADGSESLTTSRGLPMLEVFPMQLRNKEVSFTQKLD